MEGILALIPHAPAATLLLAITLATSLYDFLIDGSIRARFILHPYTVVRERQWYRLFTSTLLHGDWLHLFLNLFVYYNFAFYLEAVFYRYYTLGQPALVSSLYFTVIYVGSGILASLALVFRHRADPGYYGLGASGAIAGILFSFILLEPSVQLLVFFVPLPAWLFGLLYLVFSYVASRQQHDRVAHDAHFWGALVGALLTLALMPQAVLHRWAEFLAQ